MTGSPIVAAPVRLIASVIVTGRLLTPSAAAAAAVAAYEYVKSFGVTSPCDPSSKNTSDAPPPIAERLPTTLVMFCAPDPFVTTTVSSEWPPAATDAGLAAPTPVGPLTAMHGELEFCGSLGATIRKSALLM